MNKLNFLQLFFLTVTFGYFNTANAQTAIWGVDAGVDVANAEFSVDFIETGVAGSQNDTAWTALSVSQTDPATGSLVTPGMAYWKRDLIGYSAGAYWSGTTPHGSPSQANGSALFDSDFYDNNGTAGAFGTGICPSPHVGQLISPLIDLSGYTDSALTLKVYCHWRNFGANVTAEISTDNGITWSAPASIADQLPAATNAQNEGWAYMPFYNVTAGVANLTQCRIRFTFDGDYYFAFLDDVSLITAIPTDIGIGAPDANGATWAEAGAFSKLGNHRYLPEIMADSITGGDWLWALKVVNNGAIDILPTSNPMAWLAIDYVDPVTGTVTANVHQDSAMLDTLAAGAASFRLVQQNLSDLSFLSTYGAGDYQVKYWVTSDEVNGIADNDTVFQTITITDNNAPLKNYLSKVRLDANGDPFDNGALFPGGGPYNAYEIGSVFYFARGATDSISIDSIKFRYYIYSTYSGADQGTLLANVYEWTDNDGNFNVTDQTELSQIGVGVASLSGLTSQTATYSTVNIPLIVDPATGQPLGTLSDNKYYYISLSSAPGVPSFAFDNHPWFGSDDGYDYSYNYGLQLGFQPVGTVSPLRLQDAAGADVWYSSGFGMDEAPSIGLFLNSPAAITSAGPVEIVEGVSFSVYPNPATELVNVEINLDEAQDVNYVVTDNSGRVLFIGNANNVTNDVRSLNVSQFPAGVYYITAKTANGESTQRFVKK